MLRVTQGHRENPAGWSRDRRPQQTVFGPQLGYRTQEQPDRRHAEGTVGGRGASVSSFSRGAALLILLHLFTNLRVKSIDF